jgi:hypothetical protein
VPFFYKKRNSFVRELLWVDRLDSEIYKFIYDWHDLWIWMKHAYNINPNSLTNFSIPILRKLEGWAFSAQFFIRCFIIENLKEHRHG